MMSKWLMRGGLLASLALLTGAYALIGFWPVGAAMSAVILAGWLAWKPQRGWLSSTLLVLYLVSAVCGLLLGSPAALTIAGTASALVSWEIATTPNRWGGALLHNLDERTHLAPLLLSVAIGLLIAEAGLFVRFALPFGAVVFAGLLVLLGVYGVYRLFTPHRSDR